MPTPDMSDGEQVLGELRQTIVDHRAAFDADTAAQVAELEHFRQALVKAIGEVSPAEATAALAREAGRIFNNQHGRAVQALIDSAKE